MAGKKKDIEETAEGIPAVEEGSAGRMPAPPSDYCILVNYRKHPLNCPLRSGRHANLGPMVHGMSINRSEPVLKKDRTDILFKWQKMGWLGFEDVGGDA